MKAFLVETTFSGRATIQATHMGALERYLVDYENRTGWSYPNESGASVKRSGAAAWRNYVCPDGEWQRDY